ncbi:hypothetical protein TBR22_A34020 [Luteitalea sp. TBR-22]|uniref:hypothetical protein n=1 Tax=Luteitalea sp. TBR-22 TaxID=2802971 RepID=UPI001AFB0FA9|nr:hypothetical protein [Luteitalea sp. TBR-22]BCS34173.1 hypothetical protein TBR22_A34020 [Luteitalea sp. TBR-22]
MSEARIDRLLAAALHQAIADLLPMRLEFYESYLRPRGWREDAVNLAPVTAVLSFLRHEEEAPYDAVMTQAATYAAEWWLAGQGWAARQGGQFLPVTLRLRQVGKQARRHFEHAYRGTRVRTRVRQRRLEIEIKGSIFCNQRDPSTGPHCRYYVAFLEALVARDPVAYAGSVVTCRAQGGDACVIALEPREEAA